MFTRVYKGAGLREMDYAWVACVYFVINIAWGEKSSCSLTVFSDVNIHRWYWAKWRGFPFSVQVGLHREENCSVFFLLSSSFFFFLFLFSFLFLFLLLDGYLWTFINDLASWLKGVKMKFTDKGKKEDAMSYLTLFMPCLRCVAILSLKDIKIRYNFSVKRLVTTNENKSVV